MTPIVMAADFGGILRWTQFVSAFVVIGLTLLACITLTDSQNNAGLKRHLLLAPLLIWIAFAALQTIPLSPNVINWLSPGTHAAYTQWISPIVAESQLPKRFPVSISQIDSKHAIAVMCLLVGIMFSSAMLFSTRKMVGVLVSSFAIGIALHAGYGVIRIAFPEVDLTGGTQETWSGSFGTFVNRNNAALFMNLGLGCSLGLMSWRLMALTGQEIDDDQFEVNDLVSLISDRDSLIGIFSAVLCIGGLLLCGSRSGIVAMLAGSLLAFGWVRQRRGFMTLPVIVSAIGIAAASLLIPFKLSLNSLKRFEFFSADAKTITSDGRLDHWPEGFRAGLEYFPAGSGLSTYGNAYLPYQTSTHVKRSWSQHADNLWLELFVEQGIVGILLTIVLFAILIRSLLRLSQSPDPIDQGLRTIGWYFIGAILASQTFDFGLILPANLFLVSIMLPVIVARDAANGSLVNLTKKAAEEADRELGQNGDLAQEIETPTYLEQSRDNKLFEKRKRTPLMFLVAAVSLLLPILAVRRLAYDARVESLVRSVRYELKSIRTDKQALSGFAKKLSSELEREENPALLLAQGNIRMAEARLGDLISKSPRTAEEAERLFRDTNPANLRLKGRAELPAKSIEQFQEARDLFSRSLSAEPLGLDARSNQLYLDFIDPSEKRTETIISQLAELHQNNPAALIRLGDFAASSHQPEIAAEIWRQASKGYNTYTLETITLSKNYPEISISDVVPENPKKIRFVARYLIGVNDAELQTYLPFALDAVKCEECDSLAEKSKCLSLRGDIAYELQQHELAFTMYAEAIACVPADAKLRLKYVRRLRTEGRNRDALIEARRGRASISTDARFDALIKSMAADDLRKSYQRKQADEKQADQETGQPNTKKKD